MNRASTEPTVTQSIPSALSNSCTTILISPELIFPSRTSAPRNDTVEKTANNSSAHAPTDIGDQYLKMGPVFPGVVFTTMCQKRSGWPRSSVSNGGQSSIVQNEMR